MVQRPSRGMLIDDCERQKGAAATSLAALLFFISGSRPPFVVSRFSLAPRTFCLGRWMREMDEVMSETASSSFSRLRVEFSFRQ